MSILTAAEEIINGQRAKDYGDAKENHQRIADLWNVYLQNDLNVEAGGFISAEDVAVMMVLLKIARFMENGYHHDTVVDIAGYAGVLEKMQLPKEQRYETNTVAIRMEYTLAPLPNSHAEPVDLDKPKPRQFEALNRSEVPPGVYKVEDAAGDIWLSYQDRARWVRERDCAEGSETPWNGPFTEVLS